MKNRNQNSDYSGNIGGNGKIYYYEIGDSLKTYVNDWGRTRIGRGAIVIICSDGLDRGYPEVLAKAMDDLSRLSYRILWMNPHKGDAQNFEPNTLGMIVADPFIDEVFSGHNLKSLEDKQNII